MKRILFLILTGIILASCSGPRRDSAAIINGQRISYPDFVRSYQGHTANFQMRTNRTPSSEEKVAIFNETWDNITKHVILEEHFKRYGISVTEQEVIDSLMNTVPPYLKDSPALKVNGKFDRNLYSQSVRYDSPVNMQPVRENFYNYYIPIQKLKEELIDEEVQKSRHSKRIAKIAVSKADFDLLVFDPADMKPILSDNEIQAYYQKNLENFAMAPIFGLQYFSLFVEPEEADRIHSKAVTDSIYKEISQGKSFDTALVERQEQIPGLKILNPGFVRVEHLDQSLLDILEYLPDNGYSKPIPVGHGYSIYQKLQRTKSMISYRALQIPPVLAPATINAFYSQAMGFKTLAEDVGMAGAAVELDMELHSHPKLGLNDIWHPDLSIVEQVNAQLYTRKKGDYLDPIYSTISGSWIIVYLTENMVHRVQPLADVRDQIVEELLASRKNLLARQKAQAWIDLHPELRIDENAGDYQVKHYYRGGVFSLYEGHSLDIAYITALERYLGKKKPEACSLNGYYIILIPRAYYPDKKARLDSSELRRLYVKQLDPNWFESWMQNKISKARIHKFVSP